MKISLWPAGVRIPQKYNVKVNKDCEESRGETVSYFQLIFWISFTFYLQIKFQTSTITKCQTSLLFRSLVIRSKMSWKNSKQKNNSLLLSGSWKFSKSLTLLNFRSFAKCFYLYWKFSITNSNAINIKIILFSQLYARKLVSRLVSFKQSCN